LILKEAYVKFNTVLDNTKTKIMRLPEWTKGFLKRSLVGYYFSAPHPRDAVVFTKYWIMNWAAILYWIGQSIAKLGPITFIRALIKHPWILILIRVNGLANRAARDNTGIYHESICMTVHTVALGVIEELRNMLFDAEDLVIFEDLVPYDIARGMGLNCYMLELWGIIFPILVSDGTLKYIDEAEN